MSIPAVGRSACPQLLPGCRRHPCGCHVHRVARRDSCVRAHLLLHSVPALGTLQDIASRGGRCQGPSRVYRCNRPMQGLRYGVLVAVLTQPHGRIHDSAFDS